MDSIRKHVEDDIERYSIMLTRFKSGQASTGEIDSRGRLVDQTKEMTVHVERILVELRGLIASWPK
jgi:hypothetical protein